MSPDELKKLVELPESDVLEFKAHCPQPEQLTTLISAFANTRGGTILLGIADNGAVEGIDDSNAALRLVERAVEAVSPSVTVQADRVSLDSKEIVAVKIEKGTSPPHLARDKAYQRIGSSIITIGSPQEPDIKGSAYQAVLGGSSAIAQGVGAVAAGKGGIAVGGDIKGRIITGETRNVVISYDSAFERVAGSTAFVLDQLELSYRQTREQSQGWYRFSAIAASIGFILIAAGIVAVLFGQTTAGVITSISGIIPEAAAALFFTQGKQANGRVDTIQEKLGEARELLTALEIANTITEEAARNEMKKSIVLKALGLESGNETSK